MIYTSITRAFMDFFAMFRSVFNNFVIMIVGETNKVAVLWVGMDLMKHAFYMTLDEIDKARQTGYWFDPQHLEGGVD